MAPLPQRAPLAPHLPPRVTYSKESGTNMVPSLGPESPPQGRDTCLSPDARKVPLSASTGRPTPPPPPFLDCAAPALAPGPVFSAGFFFNVPRSSCEHRRSSRAVNRTGQVVQRPSVNFGLLACLRNKYGAER